MTGPRLLHALVKVILVLLATAGGAGAGALLSGAFVVVAMPGAGFEAIGPLALGTVGGCVLGPFAALAALYKLPRLQREYAAWMGMVAIALLAAGALSYAGMPRRGGDSALALAGIAGLPLALLVAAITVGSLLYGPGQSAARRI